jgi:hypothetical protein
MEAGKSTELNSFDPIALKQKEEAEKCRVFVTKAERLHMERTNEAKVKESIDTESLIEFGTLEIPGV